MYTTTFIHHFIHNRLLPSTGKTRELSSDNCKEIRDALSTDCTKPPQSGVYWVQNQQVHEYVAIYIHVTQVATNSVTSAYLLLKNLIAHLLKIT